MCTSSATLFYGVCVKAMSLLVAARAWPDIEPVYLAVDLIRARRRRGDLRVEVSAGTKTVADLPDEIWEAVKVELSSDIFVEAADSFVRSYHRDPDCDCRSCLAASSGVLDIWYLAGCDACIDDFLHSGGLRDWYAKEKESIEVVLRPFRLTLAAPELVSRKKDSGGSDYPSTECETIDDGGGGGESHAMIDFDEHIFELPHDARARFHRLFTTFPQLEADYYPTMTVSRQPPPPPTPSDKNVRAVDPSRQKRLEGNRKGRVPRWLLWTRAYECA
ncbi:RHTO0S02e08988g2_1 [Rhodotorula toruloides]|uniref:RHTO0S02e08988g2_1 n=1 Tax=Rhodotorula toruloides TaxID=5286 RepID=A0A061AHC6_RHOTO|nr:RHTO0S02e08988g2_1 [Rhodotorula toruloides]